MDDDYRMNTRKLRETNEVPSICQEFEENAILPLDHNVINFIFFISTDAEKTQTNNVIMFL